MPAPVDPLALGQRVVAILQTGRRTATYKLATLMALMEHSLDHLPEDSQAQLVVPIRDLAERVLEIYWHQVLPFEGDALRQSTQPRAVILREALRLRTASKVGDRHVALAVARLRAPSDYDAVVTAVALTLVRQPLHRLQRTGLEPSPTFLYDDSWMHDTLTLAQLAAHGGAVELYPGVAWSLARLSGLLKPALEVLWVDDVRRWNRGLVAHVPDIAGHLFGRNRVSLAPARSALLDTFGTRCFYCGAAVGKSAPVDHVLPWSRVGIDGLANLVVACATCNTDKSQTLPSHPDRRAGRYPRPKTDGAHRQRARLAHPARPRGCGSAWSVSRTTTGNAAVERCRSGRSGRPRVDVRLAVGSRGRVDIKDPSRSAMPNPSADGAGLAESANRVEFQ